MLTMLRYRASLKCDSIRVKSTLLYTNQKRGVSIGVLDELSTQEEFSATEYSLPSRRDLLVKRFARRDQGARETLNLVYTKSIPEPAFSLFPNGQHNIFNKWLVLLKGQSRHWHPWYRDIQKYFGRPKICQELNLPQCGPNYPSKERNESIDGWGDFERAPATKMLSAKIERRLFCMRLASCVR